ncbi:MAG: aminoglycoside 6-adenylyltransferase [Acholeplasmatales bacterium]|nr:MAG: aminoglycoside 6-adenylyltransferase [Acholeplasmatales bacterium]
MNMVISPENLMTSIQIYVGLSWLKNHERGHQIMRDEQTMRTLILNVANSHKAIRVVTMNGSRVNPETAKDVHQDYDIVYYFDDADALSSRDWPTLFGDVLIMQTLEDMVFDPPPKMSGRVYLMQFTDGNRIDLSLKHVDQLKDDLARDTLTAILLDKDKRIVKPPKPSLKSYHVRRPSEAVVASCVNECFWVAFYVLKGVARNQMGYAQVHLDILRRCLEGMLAWSVGIEHDFAVSTGKHGANFTRYLRDDFVKRWLSTWPEADPLPVLHALSSLLDLFVEVSAQVSDGLQITNPVLQYTAARHEIAARLEKLITAYARDNLSC